jgi:agmatinase
MMQNQFLGEELTSEENNPDIARFHVIPCGLEKTVSYGSGTRKGPSAIIEASHQLERWNGQSEPCLQGIFTHDPPDLTGSISETLERLKVKTEEIVHQGKTPVTLGGEHSLTYGPVMGIKEVLKEPIGIVQVDAHADLRVAYQGEKHSHASVMQLLSSEGIPIVSLGVRALCKEEEDFRQSADIIHFDAWELVRKQIHSIELPHDFPKKIYITFDLDGLDPSILPATGTPVPGGLSYYQALDLVKSTLQGRECVGFDVVELAPIEGLPASDFAAAQITYALMGMV